MSMTIRIDQLAKTVVSELENYTEEVAAQVRTDVDRVSKETVSDLKRTSPKKTGAYAKGWSKRVIADEKGRLVVQIFNNKKPSLTHLLEYGHAKKGGGMVPAKQHIQPANEKAVQKLIGKAESALRQGG